MSTADVRGQKRSVREAELPHSLRGEHDQDFVAPDEDLLPVRVRWEGGDHPDRPGGEVDPQRDRNVNLVRVSHLDVAPVTSIP
jgi:hypothetical protein